MRFKAVIEAEENTLTVHEPLPIPKLTQPVSGVYAQIISHDYSWKSTSMLGVELPQPQNLVTGDTTFDAPLNFQNKDYF